MSSEIGFPKEPGGVRVVVEKMQDPNAYYADKRIVIDIRLVDDHSVALREYNHHILTTAKVRWPGQKGHAG